MSDEIISLRDLKKELKVLKKVRGRHTELITVYIAEGYELSKASNRLFEEQGTATNIKSAATRKNVTAALTKILQALKLFKRTPKNGLAVFCGNAAGQDGKENFIVQTIIPPKPMNLNLYRCSQKFVTEPLENMLTQREAYGLIVIDRQTADIALLKGTRVEVLKHLDSMVPGKFRAGGQSAQRFERVIEGMAQDFYKKVGEVATARYNEVEELKGIIVGGPGPTKNSFIEAKHLSKIFQDKVMASLDIGYTGEQGLNELLKKSEDILADAEITKEKKLVTRFLDELGKDSGIAAYGEAMVRKMLELGAVDLILLSEDMDEHRELVKCMACSHEESQLTGKGPDLTCKLCGGAMELLEDKTIQEDFEERAEASGATLELISTETQEGQQLLNLGGIAAILRYKPQE